MNKENTITEQTGTKSSNHLFPVFVKLEQLRLLVIGGGNIALEKLQAVIQNAPSTQVQLVATEISDAVRTFAQSHPNIRLEQRPYEATDIDQSDLVIAAVNDLEVAGRIQTDAKASGKLINVADKPALCDFYLGSIVKKGNLKIAISTNGKSPTIAKRIRETLSEAIPEDIDETLDHMQVIRDRLHGDFEHKVRKLNNITRALVQKDNKEKSLSYRRIASYALLVFALMLIGHFIFSYLPVDSIKTTAVELYDSLGSSFLVMLAAGFFAQMVDGALGMGYGVTSATILLSAGVSPAAISGSIHTAEMFASGASGYSHYKFGNVNKKLFKTLLIPGVIGAIAGALLLVYLGEKYSDWVRPLLASYTLFLGIKILISAFRKQIAKKKFKHYRALAGAGGFFDSFGGGGWGPIVTTTLITKGRSPRYVIGSVSLTEFFVTLSSAFTFFVLLGVSHWQTILGLILGGLIAAPLAAKLTGKLPRKTSFILVGLLVIVWSLRILIKML
ncbi:hypothetical protein GCM10027051_21220 [Niabella terrae]